MRAKAQGECDAEQRQESSEEYAQGEVQQGVSDAAVSATDTVQTTARMSYRKFRALQEKRKELTLQSSTQSAPKPTEKVTVPTQAERRELFKKQRFRQKAVAVKKPAPQASALPADVPASAPPPCRAQMQRRLKLQHLTREAVRRYLQKQTVATAAGNTAPIVTHAPKLPTISNKQATVEAISRGVHYIAAKIKALLSQAVQHAAQSLLALLGAGSVVLVLAMVIGAAAAVIGSPMGILFADESNDPNSIPIAEIVADPNADFDAAITDIVSAHPECSETTITYDYEDGHTWASYWPEVLAVFAVHTNLNSDSDVVVINAAQIRDISKRTALYERLSKDDEQQGESNSILNQKQYLEEYAHRNGFVNIQHFTDDGYTGRNFNRPGFQEMLAEIENGKIGTVIVKDMSRFGRNYLQVGFYTEIMFPQKQVRFIAINNSVDSDKPQDNDFTPFLNIMNEWYAKDTSNKIKSIFLSRIKIMVSVAALV